jgi:hypothetical protein
MEWETCFRFWIRIKRIDVGMFKDANGKRWGEIPVGNDQNLSQLR